MQFVQNMRVCFLLAVCLLFFNRMFFRRIINRMNNTEAKTIKADRSKCAQWFSEHRCMIVYFTVTALSLLIILSVGAYMYRTHNPAFRYSFWLTTKAGIRTAFIDVDHVTTDQVFDWLSTNRSLIDLIDARTPAEFNVSHLEGAVNLHVDTTDLQIQQFMKTLLQREHVQNHTHIIVYCSAGYRSAVLVRKIKRVVTKDDLPAISSMIGSIFEWANQGKPFIVDNRGQPISVVHPHSQVFGRLLKPEFWSDVVDVGNR